MAVERAAAGASLIDVLDRVLDKGIVIDTWVRLSLIGVDLITVEARVTVASIETYLKYADRLTHVRHPSVRIVGAKGHQLVLEDRVPEARAGSTAKSRIA